MTKLPEIVGSTLTGLGILLILGFFLFNFTLLGPIIKSGVLPNYAEEVAAPIEQALVEVGARKVSSGGSNGRGIDDTTPGYGATFIVPVGENKAIEISRSIAEKNGFTLLHATKENPGIINVADEFVDNWYYDSTSKNADPTKFEEGKVELKWEVNVENQDTNPNQTSIRFDIKLPSFKQQ